jgi:putative tryptophan/tyrosine transport system substrate-binding protein
MQRRKAILDLMSLIAGSAAFPMTARGQLAGRTLRIGVLLPATANDSEYPALLDAFRRGLEQVGRSEGRNVRMDVRWAGGSAEMNRKYAAELVALAPDVIMAAGASAAGPVLQTTRNIPVVFTIVPDPVGAGFVDTLARPGGNATGFTSFDYGIAAKWLELLKEVAPRMKRVGVIRDSATTAGVGQWSAIQTAAPNFGLEATPINLRDAPELERAVAGFARSPNGGLIITSSGLAITHRDAIVGLAAKHRLPALYYSRAFVSAGGLLAYGSDRAEQFYRAAGYVDRILKGEKPGDLPVQAPTKYELAINAKTARAVGLVLPELLLVRANHVVE